MTPSPSATSPWPAAPSADRPGPAPVGRMAMSRYYANDARYMATVVAEACAIADTCGDQLTPLRCKATRVMSIEDSEEFLDLARTAEACGDLWVAGRMHAGVAFWSVLLGEPDAPIAFERAGDHRRAARRQLAPLRPSTTSLPSSSPSNSNYGRPSLGWSRRWASPTGPRP